jgi:hypothetical protein
MSPFLVGCPVVFGTKTKSYKPLSFDFGTKRICKYAGEFGLIKYELKVIIATD